MNEMDSIWAGDKLKRRDEARLLERFLTGEVRALADMGREQAFVLALDAQYGEGKSWFLTRLQRQLSLNHPVAFVDAWIDDANHEPLVSIMAALDDVLKPFFKSESVREKFGAMARAALPIIGKGFVAAGGKMLAKYVGDQFGEDAKEAIASSRKSVSKDEEDQGSIEAGFNKALDGVNDIVDSAGKALLDQYRNRQHSRITFKDNLRRLSISIDSADIDSRISPIFVIIDELDRCRPSYAISLLEEIKHLFDVPGVVFIIALHGQQLTKSIEAVYGARFDASSYLRRFFTRHYELRRLKLTELVATHFDQIAFTATTFSYPESWNDNGEAEILPPAMVAGLLLTEWQATPREVQAVIDALRLFVTQWDHTKTPIELPFVLVLLLNLVRGNDIVPHMASIGPKEITFQTPSDRHNFNSQPGRAVSHEFFEAYSLGMSNDLPQLVKNNYQTGVLGYLAVKVENEYALRFGNSTLVGGPIPKPTWQEYSQRVRELGRFISSESELNE